MRKNFWLGLCLINLCIVALFGFALRTKILFTAPFINYRSILSAHSHFAFAGWVGLALMTLLIYQLLPKEIYLRRSYQFILAGTEISALGMALFFPLEGYSNTAIIFSSMYIMMNYIFGWFYIKDLLKLALDKAIKRLAVSAIVFLLVSAIGPAALAYILITGKGDANLYRDSIYTFLHFQYNGFFTLTVLAVFFQFLVSRGVVITKSLGQFSLFMVLSVVPSLFLSLLWHNKDLFHILGAIGCALILISLFLFFYSFRSIQVKQVFTSKTAYYFFLFWITSFCLKLLLNAGTTIPQLSDEVYGDRPIIIGFLHLVFLGFVSFFIFSTLIEEQVYLVRKFAWRIPLYIFSVGIFANELFLMVQGLGILLKFNSAIYPWLLWFAAITLFTGALFIVVTYYIQKSRRVSAASSILRN
jgi:hypothetical protein